MSYEPRPIDTSNVKLPSELIALTERLAKNTHDIWAQQRIADGWTLGHKRDDAAKKHPNLVPYLDLSETEKEYDRKVSLETLKVMIALGYRIQKGGD